MTGMSGKISRVVLLSLPLLVKAVFNFAHLPTQQARPVARLDLLSPHDVHIRARLAEAPVGEEITISYQRHQMSLLTEASAHSSPLLPLSM